MKFEMLEVSNHPVVTGLVRPNLPVTDRTPFDAGRVQPERLIERNRLPALADAEFAASFATISHDTDYNLSRWHDLGKFGPATLPSFGVLGQ